MPPQEAIYDLDISARANDASQSTTAAVSSPSRVTRTAPPPPMGTPPPLPSRQRQPAPIPKAAEPPKIPQRTGTGPPPLPARPNNAQ